MSAQKAEDKDLNLSSPELKLLQEEDSDIVTVKQWLLKGVKPKQKDIGGESLVVKSLLAQYERLVCKDDILYRKWDDFELKTTKLQAIIPRSSRRTVLEYCHDNRTSGHLGVRKTLSKIRQSYNWPGLQRDTRLYIAGCEQCSKRKGPNRKKCAPMQIVETGRTMERIAIDILGELPETMRRNRYILVVSDYYSKWTESNPMPNMEARTVAKIVVEEFIVRYGVPYAIHSDQGRQFESLLFNEMCTLLHIHKTHTTPYHPQSDGMVERFNRTLLSMLSAYVNEYHTDWDEQLPYVMMAYRSSEHETTGCTPNFLMLGRETATPLDIMYQKPSSIDAIPQSRWAWELKERLEGAHKYVREQTGTEMLRQKKYHDKKLNWENFKIGDLVFVYFPRHKSGLSPKLTSYWHGPFKVLAQLSDVNYKVNCGPRDTPQVIHVDRMRRVRPQVPTGENENKRVPETNSENSDQAETNSLDHETQNIRPKRTKQLPSWLTDYDTKWY